MYYIRYEYSQSIQISIFEYGYERSIQRAILRYLKTTAVSAVDTEVWIGVLYSSGGGIRNPVDSENAQAL